MRSVLVFLVSTLLLCAPAFAEDAQLRATAISMVERSLLVSQPRPNAPAPNEMVVTFQARGTDGVMRDGSYTRLFDAPDRIREEFTFAEFHLVRIRLSDRMAFIGPTRVLPPEALEMLRLVPMQLWHLDHEDVIKNIVRSSRGGQAATCVQFDTIRGTQKDANELCFDATTGAQVYNRTGNIELLNSEFFDFEQAKLPGHIQQYRNGALVLDVRVSRKVITDPVSEDMFTPPPGSDIGVRCQTYQRAFGVSMPQPAGNGGTLTTVLIHAVIGFDGRVHNPVVESSDRPDLNDEALKVVQTWTFTPAMCNGHPNTQEANLVVRFQGR